LICGRQCQFPVRASRRYRLRPDDAGLRAGADGHVDLTAFAENLIGNRATFGAPEPARPSARYRGMPAVQKYSEQVGGIADACKRELRLHRMETRETFLSFP
jgi:hypothetical protein